MGGSRWIIAAASVKQHRGSFFAFILVPEYSCRVKNMKNVVSYTAVGILVRIIGSVGFGIHLRGTEALWHT
jgi:hypothetical protein